MTPGLTGPPAPTLGGRAQIGPLDSDVIPAPSLDGPGGLGPVGLGPEGLGPPKGLVATDAGRKAGYYGDARIV